MLADNIPLSTSPMDAFTNLLKRVQNQDAFLGSELTQCLHLLEISTSRLSVATLEAHWNTIGSSAEALLNQVAKATFGDDFKVEINVCTSKDESTQSETVFERQQRLKREHDAMRIEQAKRDPNIVLAQRVLEADIVDVKLASMPQQNESREENRMAKRPGGNANIMMQAQRMQTQIKKTPESLEEEI